MLNRYFTYVQRPSITCIYVDSALCEKGNNSVFLFNWEKFDIGLFHLFLTSATCRKLGHPLHFY